MNTRYDEPSLRISIPIADREHIFRGGTTHRSHARFGHQKGGPSWRCRSSEDCITATNNGLPEKARIQPATRMLFLGHWNLCPNCAPSQTHAATNFVQQTRQGRKLHGAFGPVGGMTSAMGCTEFSVGTLQKSGLSDRSTVIGAPLKLLSADLNSP
jgi:hypothetical protein